MDIHIAAKYMKIGYRIRRASWEPGTYIDWQSIIFIKLSPVELLAEDWEVITEGIVQDFPIITYQE